MAGGYEGTERVWFGFVWPTSKRFVLDEVYYVQIDANFCYRSGRSTLCELNGRVSTATP